MKQFLLPAAALLALASSAGATSAGHSASPKEAKAAPAKSQSVKMSRAETHCLNNARSKYKAGAMRSRAEAKCRTEAHAMRSNAGKPVNRKA